MSSSALRLGVALSVLVGFASMVYGWLNTEHQRERGRAAFHGDSTLSGRVVGHSIALPRQASRCQNCHETRAGAPLSAGGNGNAVGGEPFAAPLDRKWLRSPRSRHGGPLTTYDTAAFCTLLRTGVDPGHVMISPLMPRYDISDGQCADLLTYLEGR